MGNFKELWALDDRYAFLNHGSYGACPKAILEEQSYWRMQIEKQPVKFFKRDYLPKIVKIRDQVETFFNAKDYEIAFVQNASTAVNTVLKNLEIPEGTEILCSEYTYGACWNALKYYCQIKKVKLTQVKISYPPESSDQIVEAYKEKLSDKTKIAFLDHVSSPLGIIYPLDQLIPMFRDRGVFTIVDGAHAPGMLNVNIEYLAPDAYVGNFHKWMCAPKTLAFLALKKASMPSFLSEPVRGLVIGHGYAGAADGSSLLWQDTSWPGTLDPSPLLCLPRLFEFFSSLLGSWQAIYEANHHLLMQAYKKICFELNVESHCPGHLLGSMVAIPIPQGRSSQGHIDPLQNKLFVEEKIEVPIFQVSNGERYVRISAQLYNSIEQYEALAATLKKYLAV